MQPFLEIRDVIKNFGPVKALKSANIKIFKGKVMGLIGENGAGKSTIIKCMSGIHKLDSGSIFVNGKKVNFKGVKDAERAGIAVVHQELQLVDNISVAENVYLGRLPMKLGIINWKKLYSDTNTLLNRLNLDFSASHLVGDLTIAQQQMVEIAKALSLDAKMIILDEPTDALSNDETNILFETIKKLQKLNVSFLYVTHRMKELHEITDHVTIFRDGEFIKEVNTKNTKLGEMVKYMIGRELKERFPIPLNYSQKNKVKYKFHNISNKFVSNIYLDVKEGEILGLVGLIGSGRTEFVKSIISDIPKNTGDVYKYDEKLKIRDIYDAIKKGIYYVSENRKYDGLDLHASIKENIMISSWDQVEIKYFKFLNLNKVNKLVDDISRKVVVKMNNANDPITSLSGGNQQKILLAKAILTNPDLLILDEPTRGVDIGARKEIYNIMRELTREGKTIIMISSELPEAIGMSDRIAVFHEGGISGILSKKDFSENTIMKLATNTGGKNG